MEFELSRIDYAIVGLTYPDTLKLLPSDGHRSQQKLVIGDKEGVIQSFSIKNEEPQIQFKTLPGKEITCVRLGGTPGGLADKIFVASRNEVKGYTKKGKLFLAIETSFSETITSMCVSGSDLIIGCGTTVSHYRDLQEIHTFVCDDRVLDIVNINCPNSPRIRLAIATTSKCVLLIERGQVISKCTISTGVCRFMVPPREHYKITEPIIFYGSQNGTIGILTCENNGELRHRQIVDGSGLGAVSSLNWWNTVNDSHYLLVGRHDGSIQIYQLDLENIGEKLKLNYSYFSGESVSSVVGGCVGRAGVGEVLVATHSGRVFSLRPHDDVPEIQAAVSTRLAKLQSEVTKLEKLVCQEREKYQRATHASLFSGLSAPPLLSVDDELSGMDAWGWQQLQLSCASAIDLLLLHCDQNLLLQTDNAAVLSICPPQGECSFLATVRCQAGTHRVWLKVRRCDVGVATLRLYVMPAGAPRVARLNRLAALAAYSLHESADVVDTQNRPWNVLQVSGSFSVAQMLSWLRSAVPGDMARPLARVTLVRRHATVDTLLLAQYSKGEATFKSDNITTIAILMELLSKAAIEKGIMLDVTTTIGPNNLVESYKFIQTKIEEEYCNVQQNQFKDALRDLDIDSILKEGTADNKAVLCAEYMDLLKDPTSEHKENNLDLLIDIVVNWYIDAHKLQMKFCLPNLLTELKRVLNCNESSRVMEILKMNEPEEFV